jgi:hypothetical protein
MKIALFALLGAVSSAAFAAKPPAPHLTVAVTNIREFTFAWAEATGATTYQLWFKANDATPWAKYTEKPAPRTSILASVSVHLLEWPQARYQLKACNADGCSTSNTVRVNHDEKLDAMGYFKPDSNTNANYFGGVIALSANGHTMAVLTAETSPGSTGQASIPVAYVYHYNGVRWRFQAKLQASNPQGGTAGVFVGDPIAISGNGGVIAFGVGGEGQSGTPQSESGAVYIFRATSLGQWRLSQRLTGNGHIFDGFGYSLKLDDAGRTLAVTHNYPSATANDSEQGTVEIYRDPTDSSGELFVPTATLPVPTVQGVKAGCYNISMSGDGQTLVRGCFAQTPGGGTRLLQVMNAPNWTQSANIQGPYHYAYDLSYDGKVLLMQTEDAAIVQRLGPSGWVQEAFLTTFGGLFTGGDHRNIALSRDGKIAALGSISDVAAGLGPIFTPYSTADSPSGGVIVHERKSTGWVIRRLVKPGSTQDQWAGHAVALGDNGRVMAVGAILEASGATGIDGNRDDDSAPSRGAVWLY